MVREMPPDPLDVAAHLQKHYLVAFVVNIQRPMGSRDPMLYVDADFLSLRIDFLDLIEGFFVAIPLIPWDRRDASPFVDEVVDGRNEVLVDRP